MAFSNIVLALDLSLSSPGFAVLAVTDGGDPMKRKPIILEKSFVKTTASRPHGYRIAQVMDEMERYYLTYKPEHVVREKGFSRFPATTQALFKIVGSSDVMAHWHDSEPIAEIAPTSVKKFVTGNGRASKQDVQDAVIKRLRIDKPDYFANDDESDAVAVGLAYYIEKELIDV